MGDTLGMPTRKESTPARSITDLAAIEAFFADRPDARRTFEALRNYVETLGPVTLAATKSRVAFVARTRFLWVHQANLDGSIQVAFLLRRRIDSERVRSGQVGAKWSHHVRSSALDAELKAWIREAWSVDAAPR